MERNTDKNIEVVKLNSGIYKWDTIEIEWAIKALKQWVNVIIANNPVKEFEQKQIKKLLDDIELAALLVKYMVNSEKCIVITYNWLWQEDLDLVNDAYLKAGWKKWQVIEAKDSKVDWQEPSADNCRTLAKECKLYDAILSEEDAIKARQKAHNIKDVFKMIAKNDIYLMKNTNRLIKYHRFLNEFFAGTVRIWEDITENPDFRLNIIPKPWIPLEFQNKIQEFYNLVQQYLQTWDYDNFWNFDDDIENFIKAIRELKGISNLWDLLYKWPFLINAILNLNEEECWKSDEIVLANWAFVWTTGYPFDKLQEAALKWDYSNLLYGWKNNSGITGDSQYVDFMLDQLKQKWHYNEVFKMFSADWLIKPIDWDTHKIKIRNKEWSIRIGSFVKEKY